VLTQPVFEILPSFLGHGEQHFLTFLYPREQFFCQPSPSRHGRLECDVESHVPRPDAEAEGEEWNAMVRGKLEIFARRLQARDSAIFTERLHSDTPVTLQCLGDRYHISRERARQLEQRLRARLRDYLSAELGER